MTSETITQQIKSLWEEGLSTDNIKQRLSEMGINRNNHFIRNVVYRLKTDNKGIKQTPITAQDNTTSEEDKPLIVKIEENENSELYIYIKTNLKFEDWVKSNKEIKATENLFNKGEKGDFYYLRFNDGSFLFDNINERVIYGNKINMGVLRVVGISEGKKFKIDGLCSESILRLALKQFIKNYSEFYKKNVLNEKISIKGEIILK